MRFFTNARLDIRWYMIDLKPAWPYLKNGAYLTLILLAFLMWRRYDNPQPLIAFGSLSLFVSLVWYVARLRRGEKANASALFLITYIGCIVAFTSLILFLVEQQYWQSLSAAVVTFLLAAHCAKFAAERKA